MRAFKIKHFERDHPGERYPGVDPLPSAEVARLAARLAPFIPNVHAAEPLPGVDANPATFRLNEVWATTGTRPADELLLSFDALRSIDRMRRDDVERNFTDIWYPVSDDMFICDESASWLILVHHDGCIYASHG